MRSLLKLYFFCIILFISSSLKTPEYCYKSLSVEFEYNSADIKEDQAKKLLEWIDYMSYEACTDSYYVMVRSNLKPNESQSIRYYREFKVLNFINNHTNEDSFLKVYMSPVRYIDTTDDKEPPEVVLTIERWYRAGYIMFIYDR